MGRDGFELGSKPPKSLLICRVLILSAFAIRVIVLLIEKFRAVRQDRPAPRSHVSL
jgi:hypothetical protein